MGKISDHGVQKALKKLKKGKSVGPDDRWRYGNI